MTATDRRIRRLLRWYPRAWRETHEAEFTALLEDSMSERPFWPHRGLNIAMEGSQLRFSDFSRRLSTPQDSPMSPRRLWFSVSLVLFVGYSIAFVTVGSTSEFGHGFEDATKPTSLVGGTVVILLGLLICMLGLRASTRDRSARASWPSLVLGSSLVAVVAFDWWVSRLGGQWGWSSISNSFISLNPLVWQSIFTSPYSGLRWASEGRFYIVVNLCLLAMIAVSGTTLVRRLRPSEMSARSSRILIIGMLALVVAAWVWVIHLRGSPLITIYFTGQHLALVFIASAVTVAAASTSLAFLGWRGRAGHPYSLIEQSWVSSRSLPALRRSRRSERLWVTRDQEVAMMAFYGVSSLLIVAALIGSIWGVIHALARPSNKAWAVVFATCIVLLTASATGLLVIHAPYLLRTVDHLALVRDHAVCPRIHRLVSTGRSGLGN